MISRSLQIAVAVLLVAVFALGFYALRLKRAAEQPQQTADTRPITPPVAGPTTQVTLFVATDADGALHPRAVAIALPEAPALRAREVLRALLAQYAAKASPHPVAPGADVKDVFLVNGTLAVVDTTAAFADAHRSGILVEELTLASMARTLAENVPGVTRMKVLVEGKERDTLAGHAAINDAYDVANANRLVRSTE
jgi:hypothetical protein